MKYLLLIFLPSLFFFGFWAGQSRCRKSNKARRTKTNARQKIGELFGHKVVLVEIREGRLENAIELLEFSSDCLISRLWHGLPAADTLTRNQVLQFLKDFRAYRQRWPRQPRGEALASEGLSIAEVQETADEAMGILNGA